MPIFFSSRRATTASITLVWIVRSLVGLMMRFLTTCCVIVDPPCSTDPVPTLAMSARRMLRPLTPSCFQKSASSTARIAAVTGSGTRSSLNGSRFSTLKMSVTLRPVLS